MLRWLELDKVAVVLSSMLSEAFGTLSKLNYSIYGKPGLHCIHVYHQRGSLRWKWGCLSTLERSNFIRRTPAYLTPLPAVDRQGLPTPFSVFPFELSC